jgi:penicillin amidase
MNLTRLLLRLFLGRRLPVTSGRLMLPGLHQPLTIRRDRYSIPYIDAETEDDAWFGLGFCQAQDRAFQLELRLRTVRGTLSALFGEQTLPIDRLSRRVGLLESAQRQLPVLDKDVRRQVEAFVRGLNAGLDAGSRRHAPEFALLRTRPTRWETADVLGIGKLMSLLLIGNWDVELSRLKILMSDGPQALRDLNPTYPEDHPFTAQPGAIAGLAIDHLAEDMETFLSFLNLKPGSATSETTALTLDEPGAAGSNCWAIAGARTASGRPILASDPHLEGTLPPHWYLAHLRTPDWAVAGASLIGAPAIGIGHNGFAAWGLTAGLADAVDLFIEDVGPDGKSVGRGDTYVPCETRREVIEVKGKPTVVEDVLITPNGPLIGPALDGDVGAIAMRAVWLEPKAARGLITAHKARSFAAFRKEFEAWPLFSHNVVYADADGTIGWQLAGETPRRRNGWGLLPLPARDPGTGWQGESIPFTEMPHLVDPEAGFIVSANNQPALDTAKPYLGADWLDGYRAARISEALAARSDWDRDTTMRLQLDEISLTWREIRDTVLTLPSPSAGASLALELLRSWDGVVAAGSTGAAVFEIFLAEMRRRIARAKAPNSGPWALGGGFTPLLPVSTFTAGRVSRILRLLREQHAGWFSRAWPEEMTDALAAAIAELRQKQGQNPSAWTWGRARPITLLHPVGRVRQLAPVFNRGPFPRGGDSNTISPSGTVIASLRMVVEVGDWDGARFVLPGGQSGNPLSPHYDDMLSLWHRGEGVPIAWSAEASAGVVSSTLHLMPLAGANPA